MGSPQYYIEARSTYFISFLGINYTHNYWVMRDSKGNVIRELHGLATDKNDVPVPIGTSKEHVLSVHDLTEYMIDNGEKQ